MAKRKRTTKAKTSRKIVRVTKKGILHRQVDNKLSLVLIAASLIIFVLAAISMGK